HNENINPERLETLNISNTHGFWAAIYIIIIFKAQVVLPTTFWSSYILSDYSLGRYRFFPI
ncbi:hypothetical protein L9F63_020188, partial [Diploptera punctata]